MDTDDRSQSGTRPEFTVVSGVSTGALIAPLAYLGPDYDHILKDMYTTMSSADLFKPRGIAGILTGDAVADTTPLRERIAAVVDEKIVAAIAAEYATGRALIVVTTNIDAGRSVAWDLGEIAASGSPGAVDLIRDVLLASASVPAAFPPVMINVEADGKRYDEMHVDGSATSVVHMYPIDLDVKEVNDHLEVKGKPNIYLVRNGFLRSEYSTTERNTLSIAVRSVGVLMGSVAAGDEYRIYLAARRDDLDFHMASIPESFDVESEETFDPEYLRWLYSLGYEMAKNGYAWSATPPGYELDASGGPAKAPE